MSVLKFVINYIKFVRNYQFFIRLRKAIWLIPKIKSHTKVQNALSSLVQKQVGRTEKSQYVGTHLRLSSNSPTPSS